MLVPSALLSRVSIKQGHDNKESELRASNFITRVNKHELSNSVLQVKVLIQVMGPQHCPRLRKPVFSWS